MVVSVRTRAIGPAELATIANRVVNCISRLEEAQPNERTAIFKKAIEFIDTASLGDAIMKTGKLRANASDSLRNYGWFTRALTLSSSNRRTEKTEDFSAYLKELRNTVSSLEEGKSVPKEKIDEVKDLFAFLRKIALAIDTLPTDKITVHLQQRA
ncbi:MAG: hypothetical protein OEZ00_00055 [Dehalococcoidia bacterium]|nr:hypothetical protein [Dehalococcoidia bacterium]